MRTRSGDVLKVLETRGLLLEADVDLPSVTTIIAGEPVKGSWWGHAKGRAIYSALSELLDHRDVTSVKLVNGKNTLVHRRLWGAVLGAATSGEAWQSAGLTKGAIALLALVQKEGTVRTDAVKATTAGDLARELERRLLVHGGSVPTDGGSHAKVLRRWDVWTKEASAGDAMPASAAKRALEDALSELGGGKLPWHWAGALPRM
jgi:hypothetical protein